MYFSDDDTSTVLGRCTSHSWGKSLGYDLNDAVYSLSICVSSHWHYFSFFSGSSLSRAVLFTSRRETQQTRGIQFLTGLLFFDWKIMVNACFEACFHHYVIFILHFFHSNSFLSGGSAHIEGTSHDSRCHCEKQTGESTHRTLRSFFYSCFLQYFLLLNPHPSKSRTRYFVKCKCRHMFDLYWSLISVDSVDCSREDEIFKW